MLPRMSLLARLHSRHGLVTPEQRAWAWYDGGNLAFFTTIVTAVFPSLVALYAAAGMEKPQATARYGAITFEPTGNMGMADIETALRWGHDNIETFGGDPDNVTIFGQSGGSGKVVHLMHMPSAEGLFHRGIAQSSGNAAYLTSEESARIAALTLENLGLDGSRAQALKSVPYADLLEAASAALDQVDREVADRALNWRPIQDGVYIEARYSDFTADMPFIAGTTFSERTSTFHIGDGRKNEWTEEETIANLRERYGEQTDEIIAEFPALFPHKTLADAYFYSANYRPTVREALDLRLSESRGPVYNYLFTYEAPVNGGVMPFHCSELIYVFHNVDMPELQIATGAGPTTYAMQDTVARAWVNFATTGDPSQDGLAWEPYTVEGQGTMVFDTTSEVSTLDDRRLVELMEQ